MSELNAFKRGQRGKERLKAELHKVQESVIKRNARITELEEKLASINQILYAEGAPVGSTNYFAIRLIVAPFGRSHPVEPIMVPIKPEPLPGCDCLKCGRGHMVEEVQYAGFTKCDHCGHSLPF